MKTRSERTGHRWFAATYDLLLHWAERRGLGDLRRRLIGAAAGRVLEIGVGTGANLLHYSAAVEKIVATEPDPFMLRRARTRAQKRGLDVTFQRAAAEALPFPDASFDAVVSTLVLCTVVDPPQALAEVRRVLKPSGTFRLIEHVRADGLLGQAQDAVTPLWRRVGAGCHPNRRTAERIEAAGFELVGLERRPFGLVPLILAEAKPEERTVSVAESATHIGGRRAAEAPAPERGQVRR